MPSWIRSSSELLALVLLRDRDDQAQVRVDHALLGGDVALLDPLGELDLLGGGQQRVAADLVEEELQRVGGHVASSSGLNSVRARVGAAAVVGQLDAARVDALVERCELLVLELELLRQIVDLAEVQAAVLLPALEQGLAV